MPPASRPSRLHLLGLAHPVLELLPGLFGADAFGHVPAGDGEELLAIESDLRERGFDRKLLAVRAEAANRAAFAHFIGGAAAPAELPHVLGVNGPEAFRNQRFDGPADHFIGAMAEDILGGGIEQNDAGTHRW